MCGSGSGGQIDGYGISDRGLVRRVNQDQFLIAELSNSMSLLQTSLEYPEAICLAGRRKGMILAVADGMGGAPAGDQASALAIDGVVGYVLNAMPGFLRKEGHEESLKGALRRMMENCQSRIEANALEHPSREGMGTTLTLAYVLWPRLWIAHVGDSRAYLCRNSGLRRLTQDHTLSRVILDRRMPLQVAPGRSSGDEVLWNVLGGGTPDLSPEVSAFDLETKDVLVLATDGLTRHVEDDEILSIVEFGEDARGTCGRLVNAANKAGGRDNITVVVVKFDNPGKGGASATGTTARVLLPLDKEIRAREAAGRPPDPTRRILRGPGGGPESATHCRLEETPCFENNSL